MTNDISGNTKNKIGYWLCGKCKGQNEFTDNYCKHCGSIGSLKDEIHWTNPLPISGSGK